MSVSVAPVTPVAEYASVYATPAVPLKTRSVNVATPSTSATVVVPPRVPPLPLAIETVTSPVAFVTVLPALSRIVNSGWVVKATALTGPAVARDNASVAGAPKVNVTERVALVNPDDVAVIV